jgi:hypothetical protein
MHLHRLIHQMLQHNMNCHSNLHLYRRQQLLLTQLVQTHYPLLLQLLIPHRQHQQ